MTDQTPSPSPDNDRFLSNEQRRVLAFSLTLLAATVSVFLLIFIFMMLSRLLGTFSGVLWPVAVAGVIALILRPVVSILAKSFHGKRLPAVILLFVAFLALATGFFVLIIPPLANQLLEFIAYLPEFWKNLTSYVQTHYPDWVQLSDRLHQNSTVATIMDNARDEISKIPGYILPSLKAISDSMLSVLSFLTHFAVMPIYLFFFLLSRTEPTDKLGEQLTFIKQGLRSDIVFLVDEFIAIIVSFFRGQLIIGLIMGLLLGIGFTIIGLKAGFVIGLILGVLNIIPYLGTITGIMVTVPLAFFQPGGGPILIALVALIYVAVQAIEAWILTPKIMGDRTGLHPAMIIFAIFFWSTALDGIMGMLLAIPLTAFFTTFWRLLKRKYFRHRK